MAIETVRDAVGVAAVVYQGKDKHLVPKWQWWSEQLGPDRLFSSITADDVDAGVQVLLDSPVDHYRRDTGTVQGSRCRAPSTVNRYVAALGSLYKLLKQNRRIPRSFAAPSFKGLRLPEGQGRTLQVSISDIKRLCDAARLSRNRKLPAFIAVAATTGLRKSNVQGLQWGDINLKTRVIDVAKTKNGSATRSVVPPWVVTELNRIRPNNPEPHWEVFGPKDFRRAWVSTIERAGIPGSEGWTVHHLRHAAASILAASGASLPVIMGCLNHKTPGMALRYTHLDTKALEGAMLAAWN